METIKILGLALVLLICALIAWKETEHREYYDLCFLDSLITKSPKTKQYKHIIIHELEMIRVSKENQLALLALYRKFQERFKDVEY